MDKADVTISEKQDAPEGIELTEEELNGMQEGEKEEINAEEAIKGLDPKEQEMVLKHQKKAEEKAAAPQEKAPEKVAEPKKPAPKKEVDIEALVSKEMTAGEEYEHTKNFTKAEFSLYREMRKNRADRQAAQKERDAEKARADKYEKLLMTIKENDEKPELDATGDTELDELLSEHATIREGKDKKPAVADKDKPLTMADLERIEKEKAERAQSSQAEAQKVEQTLGDLEKVEREKNPLFDIMTDLAKEVMAKDKTHTYRDRFVVAVKQTVFDRDSISDEETCFNVAYALAKLHPDYETRIKTAKAGEKGTAPATADKELAARIARNADKKSSAGITGGGGGMVSYDDLTPEQAVKVWKKLPAEVRKKKLMQMEGITT